uniref:Uncharacterized protein n=1 Tax=Oryza punctata TaxID=4537 RepID=A0A0E0MHH8_ORYPU
MDALLPPLPVPVPETTRDWSELPADALSPWSSPSWAPSRSSPAPASCAHSWLDAARMPDLWRAVDMLHGALRYLHLGQDSDVLCAMAKVAVDRCGGRLEVFKGEDFVSDELLKYIGDSWSFLMYICNCWDLYVDDARVLAKCARIRTLKLPPSYADEEDDYDYNQVNGRYADLFDDYYSD